MDWRDLADPIGYWRYGMSTADKEALARAGTLPGAPIDRTEDQKAADRYAAGYLFTRQWPTMGPILQPVADMFDTSSLPFIGGSDPSLQAYATEGKNRAMIENRSAATQAAALRMATPTPRPAPAPTPYRR